MKKLLSAMLSPSADGRSFGFFDHSRRYTERLWNHEFIHLLQKYSKTAIKKSSLTSHVSAAKQRLNLPMASEQGGFSLPPTPLV